MEIYPEDSVIWPSNNRGLISSVIGRGTTNPLEIGQVLEFNFLSLLLCCEGFCLLPSGQFWKESQLHS